MSTLPGPTGSRPPTPYRPRTLRRSRDGGRGSARSESTTQPVRLWHPTIAATDPLARVIAAGVEDDDLADAALRHHCYELHIGAHHLAWCAWIGDTDSLGGVARRTAAVLARGPHP